jgi:recombination protein RecT
MSGTVETRTALEAAAAPREQKTIRELVERMKPELEKSLQGRLAADALVRHYLTAIRLNPLLRECTTESLLAALLLSAQVGLEPGPLGHVYLVPYKQECTWILGYTGIIELARRTDRVGGLRSVVVWDNDSFRPWQDEKGEHFTLEPGDPDERKERTSIVVTWKERAAGTWFPRVVHVPRSRVERARAASRAAQKGLGPWMTDESAMWAKTGIRAVRPWLPLSPEAAYAVAMDESVLIDVTPDEDGAAQPIVVDGTAADAA